MRKAFTIIAWMIFSFSLAFGNQALAEDNAISVRQTLDQLGKIKVKSRDPEVSPAIRPLLTTLKHQLRDLISVTINNNAVGRSTPDELLALVKKSLEVQGITVGLIENEERSWEEEKYKEYSYNDIRRISIDSPVDHPNLLVATTTLWVMCGEDTSFYLFKRYKDIWQLILAHEALNYKDIAGAQSHFGYAISPANIQNDFYVAMADINPWCSSNWQRIRYTVARPGKTPYKPEVLMRRADTIYLGIDPPVFTLSAKPNRFRISFHGDWYWTPDSGASHQFAEYSVSRHRLGIIRRGKAR